MLPTEMRLYSVLLCYSLVVDICELCVADSWIGGHRNLNVRWKGIELVMFAVTVQHQQKPFYDILPTLIGDLATNNRLLIQISGFYPSSQSLYYI